MKKIVLLTFVLILFSTAVVVRSISPVVSYSAETKLPMEVDLPVHNIDSGKNFSTIQEAINDNETLDGHTILVDAGTYYENVVVNKSISLIGEDTATTIVDGGGIGNVTEVKVDNVAIEGFTIKDSGTSWPNGGITLGNVKNCFIAGNIVTGNQRGIELFWASNNSISGNILITNNLFGIVLSESSNNSVSGNKITNNGCVVGLLEASDNRFYHNNFIENMGLIGWPIGDYEPSVNVWDNSFEGNYWSSYNGTDANQDGIGDTPYVIDGNNTDNYPLMGMFSDFQATPEYSVQTICNSSISDFQFNGTAIGFNVSGEEGATGFCRICIPTALMETYRVFVNGTEVSHTLLPCSTGACSYLYFTYNHSTQEVLIVPEFPSWTSTLLLFILFTVAIAIYKRRLLKTQIH